jgi:hypothetical protein
VPSKEINFIQDLIRNITRLRHMMENGFFIVKLRDIAPPEMVGMWISSHQWGLCKYPTPKDQREGIVVYETYDQAYENAVDLMVTKAPLEVKGIVNPLNTMSSLRRKLSMQDMQNQASKWKDKNYGGS